MIKTLTTEIYNGSLRIIEKIVYSNGKVTKKVIDPVTGLPTEFISK